MNESYPVPEVAPARPMKLTSNMDTIIKLSNELNQTADTITSQLCGPTPQSPTRMEEDGGILNVAHLIIEVLESTLAKQYGIIALLEKE